MGILDAALQSPGDGMDPQSQGILKAAFALLSSSGATRVPTGMGQALGQAGAAGVEGYEQAKAAQAVELQRRLAAAKAASELQMQQDLQEGGGILNSTDPAKMRAVGMRLAAAGHPGGAALISQAEKIEAKQQAQQRLAGLQTQVAPDPQELEQSADQGTPVPTGGGIFASLANSPYVGEDARRLQAQLDRDKGANPDDYLKRVDLLAAAHRAASDKETARIDREMNLPKSMVIVQDRASPTGWSHQDTRNGQKIPGAPPPSAANGQPLGTAIPDKNKDLHGDEYLKTLPTGMGALVKSIAEGKLDPSKAASLRYGNREAIMQHVMQYDPKYNQQRVKVYQDFTSGPTAKNITAMNTVVSHMGTVRELLEAQKNGNVQGVNAVLNRIRTELGDASINNTQIAVQAMGNELMRVFRQVGAASHETKEWEEKFNAAKSSPAQMLGALKVGVELLNGRLEAVNDQWKRGMDTDSDYPVLSPKAKAAFDRLSGRGAQPAAAGGPYSDTDKERRYQEWKARQGK